MRHPNWPERLHDYIAAAHDRPHQYGQHDCLLHAAAVAEAVTGKDHAKKHRGKYKSQTTAVRHLKKLGFDSPEALIDSILEEKPIGFAQRGDLVLVPGNDGDWAIPAVCIGGDALAICTDGTRDGLFRIPRDQWLKAWSFE